MRPRRAARPPRPRAARLAGLAVLLAVAAVLSACADDPAAPAAAGDGPAAVTYPWAHQPDGAPKIADVAPEASLEFPPGTQYGEALTALFVAARDGGLPAEAAVRDPLPAEVVYAEEADGRGPRLSLTAPWGWDVGSGAIRAASMALPGHLTPDEAMAMAQAARQPGAGPLPDGARVDVPRLPACQVQAADGGRPPCH